MGEIKKIQTVAVDKLIPYINNAKKHSDDQVTRLASSIREFGFVNPILIDKEFNVIAGHGRLMAAKRLNMGEVPCLFVEGLSEAQRKAYILADNRLGELASWDTELVNSELEVLQELDFDIDVTGFELPGEDESPEVNTDTDFNYREQYGVIVMCADEAEQEKIYNSLIAEGYECKVVAT